MALKDIYIKAIDKVIKGELSKEELWEVFEEHLDIKTNENNRLSKALDNVNRKYKHLLVQTKEAYEEHKRVCGG